MRQVRPSKELPEWLLARVLPPACKSDLNATLSKPGAPTLAQLPALWVLRWFWFIPFLGGGFGGR